MWVVFDCPCFLHDKGGGEVRRMLKFSSEWRYDHGVRHARLYQQRQRLSGHCLAVACGDTVKFAIRAAALIEAPIADYPGQKRKLLVDVSSGRSLNVKGPVFHGRIVNVKGQPGPIILVKPGSVDTVYVANLVIRMSGDREDVWHMKNRFKTA